MLFYYGTAWFTAWPILQVQGRQSSDEGMVCEWDLESPGDSRLQPSTVRRPQLPDWSSYNNSPIRDLGLAHKNIEPLGKLSLYAVCENSTGGIARCGSKNGAGREMQGRLKGNLLRGETE